MARANYGQDFIYGDSRALAVGTSAVQGPDVACRIARIIADPANSDTIAYKKDSAITVPAQADDANAGAPLTAGQSSNWIPVANLNELYVRAAAASQGVVFEWMT